MATLTAIATWIAVNLGGAILGAIGQAVTQWLKDQQDAQAQVQTGASTVEAAQAKVAAKVIKDMADQATVHISDSDALDRLDKGTA